MKGLKIIFLLAIFNVLGLMSNELRAQDENAAFYIYQNDGHFDGFFYDEVMKMSYSKTDTAGVEYDVFVSQEIVTADSTYRIMLSAIDSVSFVQPEMKLNPRLREVNVEGNLVDFDFVEVEYQYWEDYQLVFRMPDLPYPQSFKEALETEFHNQRPKVGDVFVCWIEGNGWAQKVISVEQVNNLEYKAKCEDITDISDIIEQFVGIEEYGFDDSGKMIRRRVAGRPDLTVGKFPRKASGTWEGDLFNFSINGHLPLYYTDDLSISIDPTIEGKLHVKTQWKLALWGDKYISIHSKLNFGVGAGLNVDGKIKDLFPGGIGGLAGGVPIPATCPLLYLDITPGTFLRGEAHVSFKATTPKLNGAMWSKLEIKNWVPSLEVGFGNSDDGSKFETADYSSAGVTLSLNGFIQGGLLFPMKFKSLPIIQKLFKSEIGGQWFVGPKIAADFTLDLTTMPWNDVATYNQLKNITASLHMLDADYEVTGKVKTAFSDTLNVTLADGSISLFPPFDAHFVPEFGECEEYYENRLVGDQLMRHKVYAFEPSGYVITPINICTYVEEHSKDPVYGEISYPSEPTMYYHFAQLFGQKLEKNHWARAAFPCPENSDYPVRSLKMTLQPGVQLGGKTFKATPAKEVLFGIEASVSGDTLWLNHDGTVATPITVKGKVDIPEFNDPSAPYVIVRPIAGGYELTSDPEKFTRKNYSPRDTIEHYTTSGYRVTGTVDGTTFCPVDFPNDGYRIIRFLTLPNLTEDPIGINMNILCGNFDLRLFYDDPDVTYNISRCDDNHGWNLEAHYSKGSNEMTLSYSLLSKGDGTIIQGGNHAKFEMRDIHLRCKYKYGEETHIIDYTNDYIDYESFSPGHSSFVELGVNMSCKHTVIDKNGHSTTGTANLDSNTSFGTVWK
ncbi:MAG: hypothetical protein J6W52_06465 [Bacteroidaceae bacterium]|nr:hypothetical protein [Bacteroidaceae bacterium]